MHVTSKATGASERWHLFVWTISCLVVVATVVTFQHGLTHETHWLS